MCRPVDRRVIWWCCVAMSWLFATSAARENKHKLTVRNGSSRDHHSLHYLLSQLRVLSLYVHVTVSLEQGLFQVTLCMEVIHRDENLKQEFFHDWPSSCCCGSVAAFRRIFFIPSMAADLTDLTELIISSYNTVLGRCHTFYWCPWQLYTFHYWPVLFKSALESGWWREEPVDETIIPSLHCFILSHLLWTQHIQYSVTFTQLYTWCKPRARQVSMGFWYKQYTNQRR